MPRSATTGIYTRVDNSFSNPVVGTTISPTDADTFFDDVEASINSFIGTSTTSLAIGTGSKTFTVASPSTKVFLPNTQVHAFSLSNSANYMDCTVTSFNTSTGALVTDSFATGGSGTITDWVIISSGARGAAGTTGATGPTSGVRYTYSTTTADADPGAGIFRLNNATVASATAAYIDNADSDGNTVTAWLDSFDDSTTTAKGTLVIRGVTTPAALAIFSVTGSVVDGTGYRKLTLTYVAGGGTFTNAESFALNFIRTGDKGADGAGAGDVTAASTIADNRLVRGDGGSKGIQQSGITVDDSDNVSGVAALSVTTIELGHASQNTLSASGGVLSVEGVAQLSTATGLAQGKHTIWVPASAMVSRTTNGAGSGTTEMTTNKNMVKTLDFDASTQEFAQFEIAMPKSWNESTVTFQPVWSHASTVTNFGVVWALQGVATSDDDTLDVAFGTEQTSTDTGGTTNDRYIGPESSAITIGGSPAEGDVVQFQIKRNVSDGSDTMAVDARLHGVKLYLTLNASTDA